MDFGIAGRRAVICGASKGLGRACAEALAAEGVEVVLAARSGDKLNAACSELGCGASGIVADLSTPEGVAAVARIARDADILITNCGGPPVLDYADLSEEQWKTAFRSNFLSAERLIQAAAPAMAERGFGRIVNITSLSVRRPLPRMELSTAMRLALTGYVAGVARQVAGSGVTINNLLPGAINTERLQELGTSAETIKLIPAGRLGEPDEFGKICAFLCSQHAAYVTGQNLLIDGGFTSFTI